MDVCLLGLAIEIQYLINFITFSFFLFNNFPIVRDFVFFLFVENCKLRIVQIYLTRRKESFNVRQKKKKKKKKKKYSCTIYDSRS